MQFREIQKEGKVVLSKDRVLQSEANKDGRAAPVTVLFTDNRFRHDPEVEKELKEWYIQFAALGAPTKGGENRLNLKTGEWVAKEMSDEQATKLGLSEKIWVTDYAAEKAQKTKEAGVGSAVLLVVYGRYGWLFLYALGGSDAARVARFESKTQNEPTEVSAEQFRTILRDPK